MTFDGVRPPEDEEWGRVLDLAQGARGFPDSLKGHHGRSVAERGGGVDGGPDPVGQGYGGTLAFGAATGHAIDERRTSRLENPGGPHQGGFESDRPAGNLSHRGLAGVLAKKPGLGQMASPLGFDDPPVNHLDSQVVAHATTNRAGNILYFKFHGVPKGDQASKPFSFVREARGRTSSLDA